MIGIAAMIGAPDLEQETLAPYSGDIPVALGKLAQLGYDGVEFMTKNPGCLDGRQLGRLLSDNGLELVGLCTGHVYGEDGLGLVGPDPGNCRRAMVRLKSFVDFAAEFFAAGTLINVGRVRGIGLAGDPIGTWKRAQEAFQELADYAWPYGIRWVLEPVNTLQVSYIHTTQDGTAMVRQVNRPNFGLMLDTYHMNIEDVSIYDSFREARDDCWFVHFADNNRRWPGSAHLDFRGIVTVLNEIGYQGYVSLEILPWPDPDSAARESIASLRRYIPRHAGGTPGRGVSQS